jgi:hypothetical protein
MQTNLRNLYYREQATNYMQIVQINYKQVPHPSRFNV